MLKKAMFLILMLLMIFSIAGCTDEDEPEDEVAEEEEDSSSDSVENHDKTAEFLLEDMESDWEGKIDFQAKDLYDRMVTEEEMHFLYEKDEALYYQSIVLESGEERVNKKIESAPRLSKPVHGSSIELHKYNGRIFALIGENERISKRQLEGSAKEDPVKQEMLLIDLEEDEVLLSKTPVIENFTIPEMAIVSGTYFPGFIYDVTADGRYLMILHSFPGMTDWENTLKFSTVNEDQELEETNEEILSQIEEVPLWVYDLKEEKLIEIPYREEIDALVPHHVNGLENGVNMIFTEQEGWLTLDIENRQVRKTGQGGIYLRTEASGPGIEQFREGTLFGDNLFFTEVQKVAPDVGALPSYYDLWKFQGDQLEHVGMISPSDSSQTFYFNDHTGEIAVNQAAPENKDESESNAKDQKYVEKLYRFSVDEKRVLENQKEEPHESLQEMEVFEVVNVMEFDIDTKEQGAGRLSMMGMDDYISHPIQDFSHLGYGILAGSVLERESSNRVSFFYAYESEAGEEKIVEIDGAERVITTDNQLIIFLGDQMKAYPMEEFFESLEK